jgi:hypothetical protein
MIGFGSIALTFATFLILAAPGALLLKRRAFAPWAVVAGGFASLASTLLLAALVALPVSGQVGVWVVAPAWMVVALLCWFGRGSAVHRNYADQELLWMALPATIALTMSVLIINSCAAITAEGIVYKGWFRADFFKHLGHLQAIHNLGLMPKDIFGGGEPLAYYWLYYLFPASISAVSGDVQSALASAIAVQSFFFWLLIYGVFRSFNFAPRAAALLSIFLWLSPTMEGLAALIRMKFDIWAATTDVEVGEMFSGLLGASTFFRLNTVIPQHQLMLAILLSWFLIFGAETEKRDRAIAALAHLPLIVAGALSTLFGLVCLAVYAVSQILDNSMSFRNRAISIGAVAVGSIAIVLLLSVVDFSAGHSSLQSPLFDSFIDPRSYAQRLIGAIIGLVPLGTVMIFVAPPAIFYALRSKGKVPYAPATFALALLVTALAVMLLTATFLEDRRLALEIQLRTSLLLALSVMIGFAIAMKHAEEFLSSRLLPTVLLGITLVTGLPSPVLDSMWHLRKAGGWPSPIPNEDLTVLNHINKETPKNALVLQYPEPPLLKGGGRDQWVAIIGGRTVPASLRATDWTVAEPRLEEFEQFFAGKAVPVPQPADYLYLSRTLHPDSYDFLVKRMLAEPAWQKDYCLTDACLFKRISTADSKWLANPKNISPLSVTSRVSAANATIVSGGTTRSANAINTASLTPIPPGATGTKKPTIHATMKMPASAAADAILPVRDSAIVAAIKAKPKKKPACNEKADENPAICLLINMAESSKLPPRTAKDVIMCKPEKISSIVASIAATMMWITISKALAIAIRL